MPPFPLPRRARVVVTAACAAAIALGASSVASATTTSFFDGAALPSAGASLTNVAVAPGLTATSMSISTSSGAGVTGTAQLQLGSDGLTITASFSYTDASNWTFTAQTGNAPLYTPSALPGIRLDPNKVTGTVGKANGTAQWGLVINDFSWTPSAGSTISASSVAITTACPFQDKGAADPLKCPAGTSNVYFNFQGAQLNGSAALTGGFTADGKWARVDGAQTGTVKAGPVDITDSAVVIWHGFRNDPYDPEMDLPDLSSLSGGVNIEYCGKFNRAPAGATTGCARITPEGVVVGENGMGKQSGVLTLAGVAWTNLVPSATLPTLPKVAFRGIPVDLVTGVRTLSATFTLSPGAMKALQSPTPITFTLAGQVAKDGAGVTLSGTAPTNIVFGRATLRTTISELSITIKIKKDKTWSMQGSADAQAVIANVIKIPMKMTITGDATGLKISGNSQSAAEQSSPTTNTTSSSGTNTSTVALPKDPKTAQYIWDDAFGIKGVHLYDLKTSIAFDAKKKTGSVGLSMINYIDPTKFGGLMTGTDWIPSTQNTFNSSPDTPCLLMGFDASKGNSGMQVNGGVLVTKKFQLGIAQNGCTVNGTTLPKGFAGLTFNASLGDKSFDLALTKSEDGYAGSVALTNMTLGGSTFPSVTLKVSNVGGKASVNLDGTMKSQLGTFTMTSALSKSKDLLHQDLHVSGVDLAMKSKSFQMPSFGFDAGYDIPDKGCSTVSGGIKGQVMLTNKTYTIKNASIKLSCGNLVSMLFSVSIAHEEKASNQTKTATLTIAWDGDGGSTDSWSGTESGGNFRGSKETIKYKDGFIGVVNLDSTRYYHNRYEKKNFDRHVSIGIVMGIAVYQTSTSNNWTTKIGAGGYFDADRVSGAIGCVFQITPDDDFECGGQLRLDPSWAGVYHFEWGDL